MNQEVSGRSICLQKKRKKIYLGSYTRISNTGDGKSCKVSLTRQLLNSGQVYHNSLVQNAVNVEIKGQVHKNVILG